MARAVLTQFTKKTNNNFDSATAHIQPTMEEVIQHSSACTTTQEHTQPIAMMNVEVIENSRMTMTTQSQQNLCGDDETYSASQLHHVHKQTAFACSSSTVSTCPQPNIEEEVTKKFTSSSTSEILSATALTATLTEEGAKRPVPSSFEILFYRNTADIVHVSVS